MKIVNVHAAKTQLSRLIAEAAEGEEIVIAKAGETDGAPRAGGPDTGTSRFRRRQGANLDQRRVRRAAAGPPSARVWHRAVNLLLDTQALIWWRQGNRNLGPRARTTIEKHAAAVRVSAATAWEIAIKSHAGRLRLREPLQVWMPAALESSGFGMLSVTIRHAIAVATLPHHHPDPFDRLLIAQAQLEELTIVTSDAAFEDYDVKLLDART